MQNTHFIFTQSFVSLSALYMQNTQLCVVTSTVHAKHSIVCCYQYCTCKTLNCVLLPVLYMQNTHFIFTQSFVSLPALYMQNPHFTLRQCLVCHYQQYRSITIISEAKMSGFTKNVMNEAMAHVSLLPATFQSPPK